MVVFVIINCKQRKVVGVINSARKAKGFIGKGVKIEVWENNICIETIYAKQCKKFDRFISQEKAYIGWKQKQAEKRNKRRKGKWPMT